MEAKIWIHKENERKNSISYLMHFRQVDEICWPCKKEKLALQRFLKYSSFYRAHKKKKDSFSSCRHTCWTFMKVCCPFLSLISDKLIMLSTCNNSQTFHVFLSPIFSSMMDCQFSLYNLFGLISICSGRIYIYIYRYGCFCSTTIWLPQKLAKGQRLCGLANSNNIASFSIIGAFMQPYSSIACLWAS